MPRARLTDHLILILGCVVMLAPVTLVLGAGLSTRALTPLLADVPHRPSLSQMLSTSLAIAAGVALVKTAVSFLAAYALSLFRIPYSSALMALLLLPLFLPIESRLLPTILVADSLGLLNTYTGLILPITATGLGTLILRAYLLQMPPEILEAARLDGAGPLRALWDIYLPNSLPAIAALIAFFFVLGWNQYLWPLVASPSEPDRATVVSGLTLLRIGSPPSLALAAIALLPPLVVFIVAQRWITRGLAPVRD